MASLSSTSLAVSLAHAVSFLVSPLANIYSPSITSKLQTVLEANLAAAYVATWNPAEPFRGSGRRSLSFSPDCLPPRPVFNACLASGVEWSNWIHALGNVEFDLFVDPGCVSVRLTSSWQPPAQPKLITIWSHDAEPTNLQIQSQKPTATIETQPAQLHVPRPQPLSLGGKTLAQSVMEADLEDEDALFSMLADELRAPTWATPVIEQFPSEAIPVGHSRSSSRSSIVSSSAFSFSSEESHTSCGSFTSHSSSSSLNPANVKLSRRERARQSRVFVDTSKNEVTPYDGGKTTVLTGGVMLGAPSKKQTRRA